MSNSASALPASDLSEDDLALFFKSKLDKMTCPTCGGDRFDAIFSSDETYFELKSGTVIGASGSQLMRHTFPALFLTCDNCAHTPLFSYKKVRDLIRQIKSEVADGRC